MVTKQQVEEVMFDCLGHALDMLTIATGVSGPAGEEAGEGAASSEST